MIISINELPDETLVELKTVIDEEVKKRDDAVFHALANDVINAWNKLKEYDKYASIAFYEKKNIVEFSYPRYISSKTRTHNF